MNCNTSRFGSKVIDPVTVDIADTNRLIDNDF